MTNCGSFHKRNHRRNLSYRWRHHESSGGKRYFLLQDADSLRGYTLFQTSQKQKVRELQNSKTVFFSEKESERKLMKKRERERNIRNVPIAAGSELCMIFSSSGMSTGKYLSRWRHHESSTHLNKVSPYAVKSSASATEISSIRSIRWRKTPVKVFQNSEPRYFFAC